MTRPFALVCLALLSLLVWASSAAAETDHLACIQVKDNKFGVPSDPQFITISDIVGDSVSNCVVKKVKLTSLCIRVEKDGGDDPRGGQGAAEAYGCYKVKCDGDIDGTLNVDDQFGNRNVERKKLRTICTPVDVPPAIP